MEDKYGKVRLAVLQTVREHINMNSNYIKHKVTFLNFANEERSFLVLQTFIVDQETS